MSLSNYEAATHRARELRLHQISGDFPSGKEPFASPPSKYITPAGFVPEFVYDTERMIEESIPAHTAPLWLHLLVWTTGIGIITSVLVIVAIFVAGMARPIL